MKVNFEIGNVNVNYESINAEFGGMKINLDMNEKELEMMYDNYPALMDKASAIFIDAFKEGFNLTIDAMNTSTSSSNEIDDENACDCSKCTYSYDCLNCPPDDLNTESINNKSNKTISLFIELPDDFEDDDRNNLKDIFNKTFSDNPDYKNNNINVTDSAILMDFNEINNPLRAIRELYNCFGQILDSVSEYYGEDDDTEFDEEDDCDEYDCSDCNYYDRNKGVCAYKNKSIIYLNKENKNISFDEKYWYINHYGFEAEVIVYQDNENCSYVLGLDINSDALCLVPQMYAYQINDDETIGIKLKYFTSIVEAKNYLKTLLKINYNDCKNCEYENECEISMSGDGDKCKAVITHETYKKYNKEGKVYSIDDMKKLLETIEEYSGQIEIEYNVYTDSFTLVIKDFTNDKKYTLGRFLNDKYVFVKGSCPSKDFSIIGFKTLDEAKELAEDINYALYEVMYYFQDKCVFGDNVGKWYL